MAVDDSYTKLLLHMDGADGAAIFTDESGKTVTAGGNACTMAAQKKFGTAAGYFDGSGDTLSIPTNADFAFGTGDFTVDMWIYPISWSSSDSIFFGVNVAGGFQFGRNQASTNWGACKWGIAWGVTAAGLPSLNTWHHIAAVRASGVMKLYLDGVQVATGADTNNYVQGSAVIGTNNLNAYIDELRVSKGIARWTANFTPPTIQYAQKLFKLTGEAIFGPFIMDTMDVDPPSSEIVWEATTPANTSVDVYIAFCIDSPIDTDYQQVTNGGVLTGISKDVSGKNLFIKVVLSTINNTVTPELTSLAFSIAASDSIQIKLTEPSRIKCPIDTVNITYSKAKGNLQGLLGGQVEDFIKSIMPVNIARVFNPHIQEYLTGSLSQTLNLIKIYYSYYKSNDEYLSASLSQVAQIIAVADIPV